MTNSIDQDHKKIIRQHISDTAVKNEESESTTQVQSNENDYNFQTKAIHAGIDPEKQSGAIVTPIYQSTNYVFEAVGQPREFEYARCGNPTRKALEDNLSALENGIYCTALATGQSAELTTLNLFKTGDHIICGNDVYGGTIRLLNHVQQTNGIDVTYIPMTDPERVAQEIRPTTKALWVETPSNPLFNIVDITSISEIARANDLITIVDNTLLTPFFQQPLNLGADIVIHSATKYLSGHNDGLGGAVICKHQHHAEKVSFIANALGAVLGSFDAWLILRGIKTLALRMREHQKSALEIAHFLQQHPKVTDVYFPGLPDHPQSDLINRQSTGHGGMLSFKVDGGFNTAKKVAENTKLFFLTESFGGVESLIQHPQTMSHSSISPQAQQEAGITDNLLRISVGLEDVRDLIDGLGKALE
ncbi:cystathionine gamma-synthase [Candidatus Methanophagaceae archaeon]|nr:cystathionine gamma-synthase [Methanophagales archaeon]